MFVRALPRMARQSKINCFKLNRVFDSPSRWLAPFLQILHGASVIGPDSNWSKHGICGFKRRCSYWDGKFSISTSVRHFASGFLFLDPWVVWQSGMHSVVKIVPLAVSFSLPSFSLSSSDSGESSFSSDDVYSCACKLTWNYMWTNNQFV